MMSCAADVESNVFSEPYDQQINVIVLRCLNNARNLISIDQHSIG
jgi:hypothetical protein